LPYLSVCRYHRPLISLGALRSEPATFSYELTFVTLILSKCYPLWLTIHDLPRKAKN